MEDREAVEKIKLVGIKFRCICLVFCCALLAFGWGIGPCATCTMKACQLEHEAQMLIIEKTGTRSGVDGCGRAISTKP